MTFLNIMTSFWMNIMMWPAVVFMTQLWFLKSFMMNDKYFSVFGFPRQLMLDNALEFVRKVLTALCDLLNVKQVRMSPYHPQSNGSVKCTHQTLIRMVGKLDPKRKSRWLDHISSICHTYNLTRSQVTSYSPHFLMFGRRPCLPIDLIFPMAHREAVTRVDCYVSTLCEHLRCATSLACAVADKDTQRFKRIYDKWAGMVALCPGEACQSDPPWNLGTSHDTRDRGLLIFRAFLNTWALR